MLSFLVKWFLDFKLDVTLEEMERLQSTVLDLRCHGLETCPSLITRLSSDRLEKLKCLLLQHNQLEEFSRFLCHSLGQLKALALDFNCLTDLPFDLRNLRSLTMLNVSHNRFCGLHFFYVICQLRTLKVLWANSTGLTEIPKEVQCLQNLRTLGLRGNEIRELPLELFTLTKLQWLTLRRNKVREIPSEIENLKLLVHLNLDRNRLRRLPWTFDRLEELKYLYLQHNRLTVNFELVQLLERLPQLNVCWIGDNLPDQQDPSFNAPVNAIRRRPTEDQEDARTDVAPWNAVSSEGIRDHLLRSDLQSPLLEETFEVLERDESEAITVDLEDSEAKDLEDAQTLYRRNPEIPFGSTAPTNTDDGHLTVSEIQDIIHINLTNADGEESLQGDQRNEEEPTRFHGSKGGIHGVEAHSHLFQSDKTEGILKDLVLCHGEDHHVSHAPRSSSELQSEEPHPPADSQWEFLPAEFQQGNDLESDSNNNSGCEHNYRLSRIRNWIQSQCSTNDVIEDTPNNHSPISSRVSHTDNLLRPVEDQLDSFISEAALSSKREINIPQGLSGSEFRIPAVQSSHQFRSVMSFIVVSQEGEGAIPALPENLSIIQIPQPEIGAGEGGDVETRHDPTLTPLPFLSLPNTSGSAEENPNESEAIVPLIETESNYDLPDWEVSIPSTAIDEQDFVTAFPDEVPEEEGERMTLIFDDAFRLLPRFYLQN